ncbi:MAG: hypothetical protein J6N99_01540 [Schwartzia sp.]|nr:hypothetical protein [Schwartzia sp. (in: firmicutes)]
MVRIILSVANKKGCRIKNSLCWRIVLVGNKSLISGSFILPQIKKAAKMTALNPYFLGTSTHKYVADEALLVFCKAHHLGVWRILLRVR